MQRVVRRIYMNIAFNLRYDPVILKSRRSNFTSGYKRLDEVREEEERELESVHCVENGVYNIVLLGEVEDFYQIYEHFKSRIIVLSGRDL